ncbi:hypothetical protein BKA65DRAFT_237187 [Rhexocercosporidium sp. MPI-PUGE-AT-0058]|nr:hypothetical protein BKA65DRAFT_237187 [Rhexocercosporidium sp. MPI-PUGE-AT-0058]
MTSLSKKNISVSLRLGIFLGQLLTTMWWIWASDSILRMTSGRFSTLILLAPEERTFWCGSKHVLCAIGSRSTLPLSLLVSTDDYLTLCSLLIIICNEMGYEWRGAVALGDIGMISRFCTLMCWVRLYLVMRSSNASEHERPDGFRVSNDV